MNLSQENAINIYPVTLADSFAMQTPKMSELVKYRGRGYAKVILMILVSNLNDLMNSTGGMNENQLKEAAKLVLEDYYFFSVSDFRLCFKNGLKGKYGKIYGKLSLQIIFEWLRAFHVEWLAFSQNVRINGTHKIAKRVENPVPLDEINTTIQTIISKPKKEKIQYKNLQHYCELNGLDYDKFIRVKRNEWDKEFKSYLKNSHDNNGYVIPKLTILEYTEFKIKSLVNSLNKLDTAALRNEALKEYSKKIFELQNSGQ